MKTQKRSPSLRLVMWFFVIFPAVFLEVGLVYSQKVPLIWFFNGYANFFYAALLQAVIIFLCVKIIDFNQVLSAFVALSLAVLSVLSMIHCLVFNSVVSLGAIASVLESNIQEGSEFLVIIPSWVFVIACGYLILCLLLLAVTRPPTNKSISGSSLQAGIASFVIILLFYTPLGFKANALDQGLIWKTLNISFNASPHLRPLSGYKFYLDEKQKISRIKKEIKKLVENKPEKPKKANPDSHSFKVDVLKQEFPELANYQNSIFELVNSKDFRPEFYKTEWEGIELSKNKSNYILNLLKAVKLDQDSSMP